MGERLHTDSLILKLSDEHRTALRATFICTGSLADRDATLGVHVSTLENRTRQAIYRLDDLYEARKQRAPAAQNR